jgi:hypothetical protein
VTWRMQDRKDWVQGQRRVAKGVVALGCPFHTHHGSRQIQVIASYDRFLTGSTNVVAVHPPNRRVDCL